MNNQKYFGFLNSNTLKTIAVLTMLVDHIGLLLFPSLKILRIIGRISFPIFSFMIANGCLHTKNPIKYFLTIFIMAIGFQLIYSGITKDLKLNILFTLSFSIILCFVFLEYKTILEKQSSTISLKLISLLTVFLCILIVYKYTQIFSIDYDFCGCVLPLFALTFSNKSRDIVFKNKKSFLYSTNIDLDCILKFKHNNQFSNTTSFDFTKYLNIILFGIGLLFVCIRYSGIQYFSLLSLLILVFYNNKKGKLNLKYLFYIFYPLHFVLLYGIKLLFF